MKIFKNEDGTLKTLKLSIFNFFLTLVILVLLCLPVLLKDKAEYTSKTTTTTTASGNEGFKVCNECNIEFYSKSINLKYGEKIKIKDILDLKDVAISYVKFDTDGEYIEKKLVDGDYYLVTTNSVGETTVKATYDKYETSIKVKITSDKILSAKFTKKNYYVKTLKDLELDIETEPKNSDLSLIKYTSLDESVVTFQNNNNTVRGITSGKATVKLQYEDISDEATVYVMNTDFTIKVKADGKYEELEEYKLDKISNGQIVYIQIKIDDTSNYTQDDVKVNEVSSGSISTKTSFDEVWSVDNKSLIYKAVLSYDPSKNSTDNSSIITFKLPDNSEKSVRLCK